jgi:hypothetical protein
VVDKEGKKLASRLFRNRGKLRFEDVTIKAGLPADLWGFGIALADLNQDRRLDLYVCGSDRLYLSQADGTFKEAKESSAVFDHKGKDLDRVTGAVFGDLDNDGDLDLITGPHNYHGPSRVHVFRNEGLVKGVPGFREITRELGIPAMPQKAPHLEIQDFDNDGRPDLYWSTFFAEGKKRVPFIARGLGMKEGWPRFDVPPVPEFREEILKKNIPPAEGRSMIYYVGGPALDYDGDGAVDLFSINWPPEGTRFYRNHTKGGNWLQVRVEGTRSNRMGIGAEVRLYQKGKAGDAKHLLGYQVITVNGGYSGSRPALVHFGLGNLDACDVEVRLPSGAASLRLHGQAANRRVTLNEPLK